jgi:hypothetical protein
MNFSNAINSEPETVYIRTGEDLSSIGLFAGSLIMAVGGLVSILFSNFKTSRCTTIDCCGIKCNRKPLDNLETADQSALKGQDP